MSSVKHNLVQCANQLKTKDNDFAVEMLRLS